LPKLSPMNYAALVNFYLVFTPTLLFSQSSQNLELFGQFDRGDSYYSGSWGYTDFSARKEFALLGTRTGTAIYAIDEQPVSELAFIPGPVSNWREITVFDSYAYVITEGNGQGQGMQIINLSNLPDTAELVTTYSAAFGRAHMIQRDIYSTDPYLYVTGTCGNCGIHILDISDPVAPIEIGNYQPGYYIHDAHVRGNYLYAAAFYEGTIDIVDISDKLQPVLITRIEVPGGNTHSAWTTEDEQFLIISNEKDGLPARIWNIADLSNVYEVATYIGNAASLTHNPYVRGDFVFFSHNTEGLRVVDVRDPALPVEVAYFDTYPGLSGGFRGLWSAYPYFPSGKIIGGNRENGLYVWNFNDSLAGRLYARVLDAETYEMIKDAQIFVLKKETLLHPDLSGKFRFGTLPGIFNLEVSAPGYKTTILEVSLEAGARLERDIALEPASVNLFEPNRTLSEISLFPNPFSASAMIRLKDFKGADFFKIYDRKGRLLRTEYIHPGADLFIERKGLAEGLYFLCLFDRKGQLIAKTRFVLSVN